VKPVTCVYQIRNVMNGDRYIGSTKNYKARVRCHIGQLRRGEHPSKKMQAAFNQDGEKSFVFEIVEMARTRDLMACEQRYLDQHPTYNSAMIAAPGRRGMTNSQDHRARISKSLMGRISPNKGRLFTEKHKRRISIAVGFTKHMRKHVRMGRFGGHCEICLHSLRAAMRLKGEKITIEAKTFSRLCDIADYVQNSFGL
jgi:group I intron endonuclease